MDATGPAHRPAPSAPTEPSDRVAPFSPLASPDTAALAQDPAELPRLIAALPAGAEGPSGKLQRLLQRWQAEGQARAPAALWQDLAQALQQGWLKGQPEPPAAAQQALMLCLAQAWAGSSPTDWLAQPLLPARLQAEAALGHTGSLARLCHDAAGPLLQPAHQPVLRLALRLIRRQKAGALLAPLLPGLAAAWQPGRPWRLELAHALALASQQAATPAALAALAAWLPRLMALLPPVSAGGPLTDDERLPLLAALGTLALRCADLPALRQLARDMLGPADTTATLPPKLEGPLGQVLAALAHVAQDPEVAALLDQAIAGQPGSAVLRLERARWAFAQGAGLAELAALIEAASPSHPAWRRALLWLANTAFFQGDTERALACYQRADALAPLAPADRARWAHLQSRPAVAGQPSPGADAAAPGGSDAAADATDPPGAPVDAATAARPDPDTEAHPGDALDLGPWAEALAPWRQLAEAEPTHDGPSAAEWQARGQAMRSALQSALPPLLQGTDAPSLDHSLALLRQLWQLAQQRYLHLALSLPAFPLPWGPAYGQLDPARGRALYLALAAGLGDVVAAVLAQPAPLGAHGSLRHALELLRFGVAADLAGATPGHPDAAAACAAARARLAHAATLLGPQLGQAQQGLLAEQVALNAGALADASTWRRQQPVDADGEVLALRDWADWCQALPAAEARPCVVAVDDPAVAGHFDSVGPQGELQVWPHASIAQRLERLQAGGLQVRLSHALGHPAAGLLRPHAWHLTMGDYPYAHAAVLNQGAQGASLRPPATWREVAEPVLVLANMDATVHRNFYHWMLLILPRIAWALHTGALAQRRLLLPADLSGWMRSSLADLGLAEDRVLSYGRDEALHLADAQVLSPLEFASPTLVQLLRQRLWRAAGLDPAAPPPATRRLFVTRRSENRRPLVSEARIVEAALALGYEVVAPETLSLLDQVRLFASARTIAGPPGAAFTNLLWAPAGARVLAIFKAEVTLPTFVDLSVLLGQHHRWLLGSTLAGFERASPLNAPYDVDLALARRELAWAADARPGG